MKNPEYYLGSGGTSQAKLHCSILPHTFMNQWFCANSYKFTRFWNPTFNWPACSSDLRGTWSTRPDIETRTALLAEQQELMSWSKLWPQMQDFCHVQMIQSIYFENAALVVTSDASWSIADTLENEIQKESLNQPWLEKINLRWNSTWRVYLWKWPEARLWSCAWRGYHNAGYMNWYRHLTAAQRHTAN